MALISKHPLYTAMLPDWEAMRHTYAGERMVKEQGAKYLRPTPGMVLDGMTNATELGSVRYDAYKSRAVFHDFVRYGVEYYIGLLHQKPPAINVPDKLKPMLEDLTIEHEGAEQLLRKINEQQLAIGRFGLMLDIPANPVATPDRPILPYIAMYNAETIGNWDSGTRDELDIPQLNFVVLNESGYKRTSDGFNWEWQESYRVLTLGPVAGNETKGGYRQGLFAGKEAAYNEDALFQPNIMGKTLDRIPFVFINAQDNLPRPDLPPMLGLANLSLGIYRAEADYRQNLFLQGQDTLVIIGGKDNEETRTGAGSVINLKADTGADAKFIGVTATGLSEQREALENDKAAARQLAGQLFDTTSKQKDSGESLQTRVAASAATLNAVALAGALGLEQMLRMAAEWVGANPKDVEVTPNLEFTAQTFLAADLKELMTAKKLGAPISLETIHNIMLERGMTELEFDDEMGKIEEEAPEIVGTDAGGNPVDAKGNSVDPATGEVLNGPMKKPVSPANDPTIDPKTGKPKGKAPATKGSAAKQKGARK